MVEFGDIDVNIDHGITPFFIFDPVMFAHNDYRKLDWDKYSGDENFSL